MLKIILIIILVFLVYVVFINESFDITANLNLLMDKATLLDKAIELPIDVSSNTVDSKIDQVNFNKLQTFDLEKLKAINKILERIKELHEYIVFNPALRPVSIIQPDAKNLQYINNYVTEKLKYYSGNQYNIFINEIEGLKGSETDNQYLIEYKLVCTVDKLQIKIIITVVINKPQMNADMELYFKDIRIDNPEIIITPNKMNINYANIN